MAEQKQRGGRRDGAGRPKEMADCVRVMVQLDRDDHERLLDEAAAAGVTFQQAMRSIVDDWLKSRAMNRSRQRT